MSAIPPVGPSTSTQNIWNLPQTLPLRDSGGQYFSVAANGAKGDGTTDDTTPVQNTINKAQPTQSVVFFPAGTYLVGPLTVPAGVRLLGSISGSSTLKLKNGLVNPSTTINLLSVSSNATIECLQLDGNVSGNPGPAEASTSVISIQPGNNGVQIERCIIKNGTNYGIFAYNATDLTVKECQHTNHGSFAVFAFRQCHRTRIQDNHFYALNSSAIKVHSADSVAANLNETAEDPIITNNIIDYRGQTLADSNQLAIELFCPANNQSLDITATGGTYTLEVAPSGATTASISYNATASQIAAALNAVGIVSQVSGTNPYTITVAGEFLLVNTGSLTGGSATITATIPPTGVYGGIISGNQIWGPTSGSNTVFGISLGGCTQVKCTNNTITGPGINIGIETANANQSIVEGNSISSCSYGWSSSGVTHQVAFRSNFLSNCPTYGAQIFGNSSGSNQGNTVQAEISGNTFVDCGTNNAQFACIFFNGSGANSIVSNNIFTIKDSPNPIRAIQIFSSDAFASEIISIISNTCTADPKGTSTHGIGLCQIQGSRYSLIAYNHVDGETPQQGNGDIDGIVLVESFGGGHIVKGNSIHSLNHHYNDLSNGGTPNNFIGNFSFFPATSDYSFWSQDVCEDNYTANGPYQDQNAIKTSLINTLSYSASITLTTTLGSLYTLTVTGDATINASSVGLPSQVIRILIINDSVSGHTITFGTNFRSSGTLVGTISKGATITFVSDGTAFWETERSTNL